MDRIYERGVVSQTPPLFPESGVIGFPVASDAEGNRTIPGAWWFYMVVEEIRNVIVKANITPDPTKVDQLAQAVSKLVADLCEQNNSWAAQASTIVELPFSQGMEPDLLAANCFYVGPLTANGVLLSPKNLRPGTAGVFIVQQDNVGGRALAFGSAYEFTDNVVPALTSSPNGTDYLGYFVQLNGRVRVFHITGKGTAAGSGGGGTWNPPAGTELSRYCSGTTLMGVYADGKGGTTESAIEVKSPLCGYVPPTPAGTLISKYCVAGTYTQKGVYADGNYGTYEAVISDRSPACGWNPPAAGTPTGAQECRGYDLYAQYHNGEYGTYWQLLAYNSAACGYNPGSGSGSGSGTSETSTAWDWNSNGSESTGLGGFDVNGVDTSAETDTDTDTDSDSDSDSDGDGDGDGDGN